MKAAIQAACSLNVSNLRDTGHSAEATPPAAKAEYPTVMVRTSIFVSSALPVIPEPRLDILC